MDTTTLQVLLTAAIQTATEQAKREFQSSIGRLTNRLLTLETPAAIVDFAPVAITGNEQCDESLDVIKLRNERLLGAFQRTAQCNPQNPPQYRKIETGRQDVVPMEVDPSLSYYRQNNPQPRQLIQSIPVVNNLPQRNSFNSYRDQGVQNDREGAQKRRFDSDRRTLPKQQRINHLRALKYGDEDQGYEENSHDGQNINDYDNN